MLSDDDRRSLERLIDYRAKSQISSTEFAWQVANFAGAETLKEIIERVRDRVPSDWLEEATRQIADNDCLQPERSPFDSFATYHQAVAQTLLSSGSRGFRAMAHVVCLPSFQPEWSLQLMRTRRGEWQARLSIAEKAIWPDAQRVNVSVKEADLPTELAEELHLTCCPGHAIRAVRGWVWTAPRTISKRKRSALRLGLHYHTPRRVSSWSCVIICSIMFQVNQIWTLSTACVNGSVDDSRDIRSAINGGPKLAKGA
jgi:hypothetical protein